MIDQFRGEYRWLSNFWLVDVVLDGRLYPSVEHAYQASKTLIPEERSQAAFTALSAPGMAKRAGHKVTMRPDWDQVKDSIMLDLVRQKFQKPELRAKLVATGHEAIVEGNTWHDNYWGICYCRRCGSVGSNRMGQILMKVREEAQK